MLSANMTGDSDLLSEGSNAFAVTPLVVSLAPGLYDVEGFFAIAITGDLLGGAKFKLLRNGVSEHSSSVELGLHADDEDYSNWYTPSLVNTPPDLASAFSDPVPVVSYDIDGEYSLAFVKINARVNATGTPNPGTITLEIAPQDGGHGGVILKRGSRLKANPVT